MIYRRKSQVKILQELDAETLLLQDVKTGKIWPITKKQFSNTYELVK